MGEKSTYAWAIMASALTAVARGTGVFLEQLDLLRGRLKELEDA